MKLNTTKTKEFELPEAEVYTGALVGIFDLGLQESQYGEKHQVHLVFEIDYDKQDGKKFLVGNTYTASLYEKATLRKVAEALLRRSMSDEEAEDFDLFDLLGKACLVDVVHNEGKGKHAGKTFVNVKNVSKIMKGQQPYRPTSEIMKYDYSVDGKNIPVNTPKHITQWIQRSKTWLGTVEDEDVADEKEEKVTPNFAPDEDPSEVPF